MINYKQQQFVAMQWHIYFSKLLTFAKFLRRPTSEAGEDLFYKIRI